MSEDWAREYFERGYGQRWGLLPPSDHIHLDAVGLRDWLRSSPGERVIDIGCGHGKYALALAKHGASVVGLDFAESLLTRAKSLAGTLQTPVSWIRGDMRQLPFRSRSASAAIVLDAFGFFDTDAEDEEVLREAVRVVQIGGRLVLKIVNGALVLDDFRETEREERDGVFVHVTNGLEGDPPRLLQRIRISGSRGSGEYERRQRLYRVEEMRDALKRAGATVLDVFADPDGTPFDAAKSSAMWIVARRSINRGIEQSINLGTD